MFTEILANKNPPSGGFFVGGLWIGFAQERPVIR